MATEYTPWQRMKAYENQTRKLEDHDIHVARNKKKCEKPLDECVTVASIDECQPFYTYYNNGKTNCCCKTPYDYNYHYCEGYDQGTHRCDRKHPFHYLHIDDEEVYPCRAVPILTSTNYGHRPLIDTLGHIARPHEIKKFFRPNGVKYCLDANGYGSVKLNPTYAFKVNQSFGYTYTPPVN